MQIILKEDVKALGKTGDVVNVKEGYARNFLLPKGLALEADPSNLKALDHHKAALAARESKRHAKAEEEVKKLSGLTITLAKEAGAGEKLFGSVTAQEIASALRREGVSVDKKAVHLEHPIRELGEHTIHVRLHPEMSADLKVVVVKK